MLINRLKVGDTVVVKIDGVVDQSSSFGKVYEIRNWNVLDFVHIKKNNYIFIAHLCQVYKLTAICS
jgi:hypothetical protein